MQLPWTSAKTIVLLSDGTGNSAARLHKTNVWRLFQALDLAEPAPDDAERGHRLQIAHYDDGVGTEAFKPLAIIGGAFGYGLKRNVLDLYTFLCRNYRPGDRIQAFGFSRGAFTIRILVGLVSQCGIISAPSEALLRDGVRAAYKAYRRNYLYRASASRKMIYAAFLSPPERSADGLLKVAEGGWSQVPLPAGDIAFMGLWDTVDAYGLPIDELTYGIDEWIWPLTMADNELSRKVAKACHALSLDDERTTFKPVLWSENVEDDPDRIVQVWFAGAHANVGGGYPNDALAYVPLEWIVTQAERAGLRLRPDARAEIACAANVHGEQYDSRAGLAGYYRYGPRSVEALRRDVESRTRRARRTMAARSHGAAATLRDWFQPPSVAASPPTQRAKIHVSALQRVAARRVAYAPISLPPTYDVVDFDGSIIAVHDAAEGDVPDELAAERLAEAQQRFADQHRAWQSAWWRRVAYLATVFVTGFLVLMPWLSRAGWLDLPEGGVLAWLDRLVARRIVHDPLDIVSAIAPGWTESWFLAFKAHPLVFLVAALVLAWLFFAKSPSLEAVLRRRAEWAWRRLKQAPDTPPEPVTLADRLASFAAGSRALRLGYWFITREVIPLLFALLVLAVVGWLVLRFGLLIAALFSAGAIA